MNLFRHQRWRCGSLLACLALAAPLAQSQLLAGEEIREGEAAIEWNAKTTCGTTEPGVTRYGMWEGRLLSRVPAEKDRVLFNVIGINTRQCAQLSDPVRGPGFRSVSREIMVYLDPLTNEIIDQWLNPWTGETVAVIHVANDPVNMRAPTFARREDGTPHRLRLRSYDDTLVASNEIPLFYLNPLAGDYQEYVGGHYHAMEIFNTFYRAADLLDSRRTRIGESRISWQRISGWLAVDEDGRPPRAHGLQCHGVLDLRREQDPAAATPGAGATVSGVPHAAAAGRRAAQRDHLDDYQASHRRGTRQGRRLTTGRWRVALPLAAWLTVAARRPPHRQ
jgi:hypothetical protein